MRDTVQRDWGLHTDVPLSAQQIKTYYGHNFDFMPQIQMQRNTKLNYFRPEFGQTVPFVQKYSRWHVCRVNLARKIFFRATNFLRKMLRNVPRKCSAFILWV